MTPLFNMASSMEKKEDVESYQEMVTENQGELVEVDGVTYKYDDSLDQDGNKITKITNTSTGEEDVLTFVDDEAPTTYKRNQWVNTGTYHKTIKWAADGEGYKVGEFEIST